MSSPQNLRVLSTIKSEPKWSIRGRTTEQSHNQMVPGPGAYENQLTHKGGIKFSTMPRTDAHTEITPGPGAYTLNLSSDTPQWTLAKRLEDKKTEQPIGPGSYTPNYSKYYHTLTNSFSKATRNNLGKNEHTPGPSSYNPQEMKASIEYTILGKPSIQPSLGIHTPGPGAYEPKYNDFTPKFTMSGKIRIHTESNNFPGPGQYTLKSTLDGSKATSMGGKTINSTHTVQNKALPGPGSYEIKPIFGNDTHPPIFGKDKRIRDAPNVHSPGPTFYNIHTELGSSPQWKFGTSKKAIGGVTQDLPGPGFYTPKYNDKIVTPLKITGPTQQSSSQISPLPGPGYYTEKEQSISKMWTFNKQERMTLNSHTSFAPGPGTYNITRKPAGPQWSILGKPHEDNMAEKTQNIGLMVSSF